MEDREPEEAKLSELGEHAAGTLARDLSRLAAEVRAYPDEGSLWVEAPGIANPGGTLVLHLTGNLLHYVGAVLGGSGYERDRDAEFGRRGVPRDDLLAGIREARGTVESVLPALEADRLRAPFPDPPRRMAGIETGAFLLHMVSHLAYHLGQVNYHRRILAGRPAAPGGG